MVYEYVKYPDETLVAFLKQVVENSAAYFFETTRKGGIQSA